MPQAGAAWWALVGIFGGTALSLVFSTHVDWGAVSGLTALALAFAVMALIESTALRLALILATSLAYFIGVRGIAVPAARKAENPDARLTPTKIQARRLAAGQRSEVDFHYRVAGSAPGGLETRSWATVVSSIDPAKTADPDRAVEVLWTTQHLQHIALNKSRTVVSPAGLNLLSTITGPVLTTDEAAGFARRDRSAVLFVMVTYRWSDRHGEWNQDLCLYTFGEVDRINLCVQHNGLRRSETADKLPSSR